MKWSEMILTHSTDDLNFDLHTKLNKNFLIRKISGDHLERISFEFNQLKNSLSICNGETQDNPSQNNVKKFNWLIFLIISSCLVKESF